MDITAIAGDRLGLGTHERVMFAAACMNVENIPVSSKQTSPSNLSVWLKSEFVPPE